MASVPTLRGCCTQAKSIDTLIKRIKAAIELCLEVEDPISNEFIGYRRLLSTDEHIPIHYRQDTYQVIAQVS